MKKYIADFRAFDSKISTRNKNDRYRKKFIMSCYQGQDKENVHPNVNPSPLPNPKPQPSPKHKSQKNKTQSVEGQRNQQRGYPQSRVNTENKAKEKAPHEKKKQAPLTPQPIPDTSTTIRLKQLKGRCLEAISYIEH